MTTTQAIEILRQHNLWRRGSDDVPPTDPTLLGQAIDAVCDTAPLVEGYKRLLIGCARTIEELNGKAREWEERDRRASKSYRIAAMSLRFRLSKNRPALKLFFKSCDWVEIAKQQEDQNHD
jgi:hypothetical protein